MTITIENKILDNTGLSKNEILIEFAVSLYKRGLLSIGEASSLAEITQIEFQRELGKRNEYVNYNLADLEDDIETLKELNNK